MVMVVFMTLRLRDRARSLDRKPSEITSPMLRKSRCSRSRRGAAYGCGMRRGSSCSDTTAASGQRPPGDTVQHLRFRCAGRLRFDGVAKSSHSARIRLSRSGRSPSLSYCAAIAPRLLQRPTSRGSSRLQLASRRKPACRPVRRASIARCRQGCTAHPR
jgi:hypothetical protein